MTGRNRRYDEGDASLQLIVENQLKPACKNTIKDGRREGIGLGSVLGVYGLGGRVYSRYGYGSKMAKRSRVGFRRSILNSRTGLRARMKSNQ